MSIGLVFWIIMLIIIVFGLYRGYGDPASRPYIGGGLAIIVLLFLLGWRVFGFIIQDGGSGAPVR